MCHAQAVCQATPQATPLSPSRTSMASKRDPRNQHTNGSVDSLSLYAKACARQSGQQLKVLGEAGFKYLSGAVENWRAGASDNGGMITSPRGGLVLSLFLNQHVTLELHDSCLLCSATQSGADAQLYCLTQKCIQCL